MTYTGTEKLVSRTGRVRGQIRSIFRNTLEMGFEMGFEFLHFVYRDEFRG